LPADRAALLAQLVEGLDASALHWLSGYAAGLATQAARNGRALHAVASVPVQADDAASRATIVFGSQTGNARRQAEHLQRELEGGGIAARLVRADAYPLSELAGERMLHLVFSTQGDGEPSDDARAFVEFLGGRRAPPLPEVAYCVLGLGDSSYPQFCVVGQRLDARLAELGARRLQPFAAADLDIDSVATSWRAQAVQAARERLQAPATAAHVTPLRAAASETWSREHPFAAEVLANQRITGRHGDKDVRHVELSLAGSGVQYQPGDAIGIWPRNPPALVESVLRTLRLDGDQPVAHGGTGLALRQWLSERRELTRLQRPFLATQAERSGDGALARLLRAEHAPELHRVLSTRQVIDVLEADPAAWTGDALVAALRPLAPRLYSIASSRKAVGDEAHLTVAHVRYQADGGLRWGAASHWLASANEGDERPLYVEPNERFRLPADGDRDLVMIGAGTGIAPFRAFLQDRVADGARGRHWLLFGAARFASDFLYQLEWQQAVRAGHLHRLDLAFSRDQPDKVYVQHRMREHGRALHEWLENGAHLYVCGASAMAREVHAALLEIVAAHGGRSGDAAADYVARLQQQGRYARDVY
jgi:sulfite reductase (NADPH) flavoprotein alpha-component